VVTSGGHSETNRQASCPTGFNPDVDRQLADGGVDAVRADDQVIAARTTVAEFDGGGVALLADPLHRSAQPDRRGVAVRCQDLVQVRAVHSQAAAHVAPQVGQVYVGQQAAAVVAQALMSDLRSALGDGGLQAQCTQGPHCVARQVDAHSGVGPGGCPLDHVGEHAAPPERPSGAETRDPGANHEDAQVGAAVTSDAVRHDGVMFWLTRNRLSGS
jgi:hypothetical protein